VIKKTISILLSLCMVFGTSGLSMCFAQDSMGSSAVADAGVKSAHQEGVMEDAKSSDNADEEGGDEH